MESLFASYSSNRGWSLRLQKDLKNLHGKGRHNPIKVGQIILSEEGQSQTTCLVVVWIQIASFWHMPTFPLLAIWEVDIGEALETLWSAGLASMAKFQADENGLR